jgi:hypothetical protein
MKTGNDRQRQPPPPAPVPGRDRVLPSPAAALIVADELDQGPPWGSWCLVSGTSAQEPRPAAPPSSWAVGLQQHNIFDFDRSAFAPRLPVRRLRQAARWELGHGLLGLH